MLTAATLALSILSVEAKKPHVLLVLADDWGHAQLGVHRKKESGLDAKQALAETPTHNIDELIAEGIKLNRHYNYKICGPARASLQSGRLAVHVNPFNTGPLVHNPKDPVSGFAGVPRNMTGLASKLREGGYRTHMVGKWDAGMATPDHTPLGRGYESWLGYYQHANGYWRKDTTFEATGELDVCLDRMRDLSFHNATYRGPVADAASWSEACKADPDSDPACYEEHLFKSRGLQVIQEHDPSEPLFLFYAFHLLHTPLQVPLAYLQRVDQLLVQADAKPFDSSNRRLLSAMLLYMDDVVGELVEALKAKEMWDNTLLIMMGDNGGAVYEPGAGNNHPLRGGKYNDFDGGVRVNAFVAGGFVPQAKRGTGFDGVISVADWYGTLSQIAGVDFEDQRAAAANEWLSKQGLPLLAPVDSTPQWDFILNGSNGRPDTLHLSDQAVLRWPHKLVTGGHPYGFWTGSLYPNCSTVEAYKADHGPMFVDIKLFDANVRAAYRKSKHDELLWWHDCGEGGCLFDVEADPTESHNLAAEPAMQQVKASLLAQLAELNKKLFLPERGEDSAAACKGAVDHGGVLGPFVDADEWYSPMPKPSLVERLKRSAEKSVFDAVSQDVVRNAVRTLGPNGYPFVRGFLDKAMHLDQCLPDSGLLVRPPQSV